MEFSYNPTKVFSEINKICCIYSYYEKDDSYKGNLLFFLENGILDDVDYYIIINGSTRLNLSIYEKKENIIFIQRENKGYDFGAYCYVLNIINKTYDYYFFMNTSVKGPYLKNNEDKWTNLFIDLFYDDKVKIVGTSINIWHYNNIYGLPICLPIYGNKPVYSHVQSMFFCLKHDYLMFLMENGFFNYEETCRLVKNDIINRKEIGLSQIALNNGWNINSILPRYKGLNYIEVNYDINNTSRDGDPYFKGCYFSGSIDKYDAVFYKNNRGMDD
jgi:hypothetical protein